MSKRRKEGDIVRKIAGAGFCGEELIIKVGVDSQWESCCLCDDNDCKEWANCQVVKDNGFVYHVSECEMLDA